MNRRKELWGELTAFCDYVKEWYPGVTEIYLFGSSLWREIPNDLDVYINYDGHAPREGYKQLFPNIHLFQYRKSDLTTYQLIWNKNQGLITNKLPLLKRERMIEEIMKLRRQIDGLKSQKRTHSRTSKRVWGYFGPY